MQAVLANDLFHPDHIVPCVKLIAALMKMANCFVAQMLMKSNAAGVGVGYAGVHVQDMLPFHDFF